MHVYLPWCNAALVGGRLSSRNIHRLSCPNKRAGMRAEIRTSAFILICEISSHWFKIYMLPVIGNTFMGWLILADGSSLSNHIWRRRRSFFRLDATVEIEVSAGAKLSCFIIYFWTTRSKINQTKKTSLNFVLEPCSNWREHQNKYRSAQGH